MGTIGGCEDVFFFKHQRRLGLPFGIKIFVLSIFNGCFTQVLLYIYLPNFNIFYNN